MRKMSAHILILKSKATEMSSVRFRSVKCNENIFVRKSHNQHSCTLRTAQGKKKKKNTKNWEPCQMRSSPASVIFITYGFDWFLKVIKCKMRMIFHWISPRCKDQLWCSPFHLWNKLIKFSNHKRNVLFPSLLDSIRLFLTSPWPLYKTKERQSLFEKRQWGESVHLWVDSLICAEHTTKPSHVLAYHYEIIGGIWLPSLCSLTMAH